MCAEFVDVLPFPDGSDWYAVDATGSPAGRALMPPLCPCPANDGLRGVDPPRWYGAMIPSAAWRGGFHMHNARGGQVFYTDLSAAPMACGHRLPPVRRALPIEPFGLAGPACCGAPMRWVPRGWACRTSGQVFDAVEEAAA